VRYFKYSAIPQTPPFSLELTKDRIPKFHGLQTLRLIAFRNMLNETDEKKNPLSPAERIKLEKEVARLEDLLGLS
jgi:hypothetical protein